MLYLVLSGLGFENGGVTAAHALGVGVTALPGMEEKYLHGELVALGTLTQLTMEGRFEDRTDLVEFFSNVGLPICWKQIGVNVHSKAQVETILNSCFTKFYGIKNWVSEDLTFDFTQGMKDMEQYCDRMLEIKGQKKWLEFHNLHICSNTFQSTIVLLYPRFPLFLKSSKIITKGFHSS